jgi:P-type Ca2+ transporter type 2C
LNNFSMTHLSQKDALKKFGVLRTRGLSDFDVDSRLAKYGANKIPEPKRASVLLILLRQINAPLIYLMLGAAVITYFLREFLDMGVILAATFINITIGFFQEVKAERALAALKKIVAWKSKVRRNSQIVEVNSENLVPGDIILLAAGDRVPADARLLKSTDFQVDESTLTGESLPQEKDARAILDSNTPLGDQVNMLFSGTVVAAGSAEALVVNTGANSEFGKIADALHKSHDNSTPLQKKIVGFTRWIGIFGIIVVGAVTLLGYFTGHTLREMFTMAVAMAVSAVPEGLMSAVIIILSVGLWRMAKRNALIRRLSSAETLGSANVICTDKTGTITEGKMAVPEYFAPTLSASQKINFTKVPLSFPEELQMILQIALLNNDSYIENPADRPEEWKIVGDHTEQALLVAATKAGLDRKVLEKQNPRIGELPFSSDYKYMGTLHRVDKSQKHVLYVKGAAEKIFPMCSKYYLPTGINDISAEDRKKIVACYNEMSGRGLRVLAFGFKEFSEDEPVDLKRESTGFTFVGLLGMMDPVRPSVSKAIAKTQQAGIKVIMMTGDHKLTAQAIAKEVGLPAADKDIVEGNEIRLVDGALAQKQIRDISVFARVSPQDKVHIVESLQKNGAIVAMTGDGVNDAPSLKKADIGIALGSGTDLSKEVADMVLLDDNYKSIETAVEEGRSIMENVRRVILYLLSDSLAEITIISVSLLVGLPLPLLATQILWVNMVDDSFPAMSLALEPQEEGIMNEPPNRPDEPLLTSYMKKLVMTISFLTAALIIFIFWLYLERGHSLVEARTMSFTLLAVSTLLYVFSIRSFRHTIFSSHFWRNKWLLLACLVGFGLQLLAVYMPFLQNVFQTVPLGWGDWGIIFAGVAIIILVAEIIKIRFISDHYKKYQAAKAQSGKIE